MHQYVIRDSLIILSETVPKEVDLQKVKVSLQVIPGVENVHHIHACSITTGVNIFSTHIKTYDLSKSQDILQESTNLLKEKFDFYFSTILVEKECIEIDEAEDIEITREGRMQTLPRGIVNFSSKAIIIRQTYFFNMMLFFYNCKL